MMRYNLACALIPDPKNRDRAIEVIAPYFEGVVSTTQIKHVDADPDLDPIRDDPRMKQMLSAAKQRLGIVEA
jgi:adenylate cyclase